MKRVIVTRKRDYDKFPEDDNLIVIEGSNSISESYNKAIDILLAENYSGWINFIHDDCAIKSTDEMLEFALEEAYSSNQLIAGVIGSLNIERSFTWWQPNRAVNGVGSIYQKVKKNDGSGEGSYRMIEWPGFHKNIATVDGCCIWIHTDALDKIRFDENLPKFDFYDIDICIQALSNKIGICTIPIEAIHNSAGKLRKEVHESGVAYLMSKWEKRIDSFPINIYTKFTN